MDGVSEKISKVEFPRSQDEDVTFGELLSKLGAFPHLDLSVHFRPSGGQTRSGFTIFWDLYDGASWGGGSRNENRRRYTTC